MAIRSKSSRLAGLTLLLALLALLMAPHLAAAPVDRLRQAQALERQGQLAAALRSLGRVPPNSRAAKHRARLQQSLDALRASTLYVHAEDYQRAQAVLRAVLPKLDTARDVYLARALHNRIARIGRVKRAMADAEALAALRKARDLLEDEEYANAAAAYKVVAEKPASDVSQALIQRAKLGQIRAETAEIADEPPWFERLWNWLKDPAQTVLTWLLYAFLILVAIGLLVAGRWVIRRLPPADRTALALEDLTAPTNERNAKNRVLTRELMTSIKSLGVGGADSSSAEIDDTPDLDGALLVNLQVVGTGLEAFESTIHDETPLKLGFVSFSPRQLLSLGAVYFRKRSKQELTGSLAAVGTRVLLAVDLEEPNGKPPRRWAVAAKGADARSEALEDMATRIVLDDRGSKVSTNWQSFRSYRSAMSALDDAAKSSVKREESLQAARSAFQRALDRDPANLLARFNLSNVLRKLGDNEAAVEHYAFLERLVESGDPQNQSAAAQTLLREHPDFLFIVRYNRASALAKIEDWDCHKKAVELLERVIAEIDDEPLPEEDRTRLQLLVRATRSSTWVFELEQMRHEAGKDNERKSIVGQIQAIRDYVEKLPTKERVPGWTTYVTARGTVQNAVGRAYYLVGRNDDAYEALERALSMTPDFGDARVNLASLLMRQKGRYSRWSQRAEEQLKRALELSPHDRKARFMLGLLYRDPAVNRIEAAKKEFAEVADAWSLHNLAEIYKSQDDLAAAVVTLRRSIHLSRRTDSSRTETDFRTRDYLQWLLSLHAKTSQSRETLEDGVELAEKLVKESSGAKATQAKGLRTRVKRTLAELKE